MVSFIEKIPCLYIFKARRPEQRYGYAYWMGDNFSHSESKFYKILLSEDFVTGQQKLVTETVAILNVHDRSKIVYLKNTPAVKYTQNGDRVFYFGIFESD